MTVPWHLLEITHVNQCGHLRVICNGLELPPAASIKFEDNIRVN
jgi:hypothetical protein